MTPHDELSRQLEAIARRNLSPLGLGAHVLLLLLSLAMTVLMLSLLVTEPALPARTRIAFAVLLVIGASWTGHAIWVLRHRRILLANQRVVGAGMAVGFCAVFAAGAGWLGYLGGQPALRPAAALGLGLLTVAAVLLVRAWRHRRHLLARREALQLQISQRLTEPANHLPQKP